MMKQTHSLACGHLDLSEEALASSPMKLLPTAAVLRLCAGVPASVIVTEQGDLIVTLKKPDKPREVLGCSLPIGVVLHVGEEKTFDIGVVVVPLCRIDENGDVMGRVADMKTHIAQTISGEIIEILTASVSGSIPETSVLAKTLKRCFSQDPVQTLPVV